MTIDDDCIYTRLNGTWIELAIRGNRVMQAGESGYIDLPGLSRRSQELLVYKMRTMIDGK